MKGLSNRGTWSLLAAALTVIVLWPPLDDRSLAIKFTNWIVDPRGTLPMLPPQFAAGEGDNFEAVEARDAIVRHYDELHNRGGLTRMRLNLKVAGDPFNPSTERQLLLALGAVVVFLVWRREGKVRR